MDGPASSDVGPANSHLENCEANSSETKGDIVPN